jgi:galactokinase
MSNLKPAVLRKVYGEAAAEADERFDELELRFSNTFGKVHKLAYFTAPGRTEIIGNHTDHNGGKILAASITMDTIGVAAKNDSTVVNIDSLGYPAVSVDVNKLDEVPHCQGTLSLLAGMLKAAKNNGLEVGGFDACVSSEVIPAAGVSSSASFEMLVCSMIDHLFNGGTTLIATYAHIGQYAENVFWEKGSGLMDQMACAVGGTILLDFSNGAKYRRLNFSYDQLGCDLVLVNTGKGHADLTQEYSSVPNEMYEVASALEVKRLSETNEDAILDQLVDIRNSLKNDRAILRALHYFEEVARVDEAVSALAANDKGRVLDIINASGNSSWMWLQNAYVATDAEEQPIPFALALTKIFLKNTLYGACRLHGGGFAGVIMCAVPKADSKDYVELMGKFFGPKNVYRTNIRPIGAARLDTMKA